MIYSVSVRHQTQPLCLSAACPADNVTDDQGELRAGPVRRRRPSRSLPSFDNEMRSKPNMKVPRFAFPNGYAHFTLTPLGGFESIPLTRGSITPRRRRVGRRLTEKGPRCQYEPPVLRAVCQTIVPLAPDLLVASCTAPLPVSRRCGIGRPTARCRHRW